MIRLGLRRQVCASFRTPLALALGFAWCLSLATAPATAQGNGGGGGGGGGGTIGAGATSGVAVDAEGVLRQTMVQDPTGNLSRQRVQEALARLGRDVARTSPLRKVSLTRLERVLAKQLADGQPVDD